jgi:pimeloyl-ACP methyl ester carboxylesterase
VSIQGGLVDGDRQCEGNRRRAGRTRAAALCAGLGLLLAGCTQVVAGVPSAAPGAPASDVAPGLERFYDQQLAWGPCAPFATTPDDLAVFADPRFDCARMEVPLDYADPDAEVARIGLLRQRADGEPIGSLVFNPGGPGGSGMSALTVIADDVAGSPLAERFDLVGFDPRGVGASTPVVDCWTDAEVELMRLGGVGMPSRRGSAERAETVNRGLVQRCIDGSGGVTALANLGTRDVARDLDVMRAVLGDDKLNYVGYSYGTRIGLAYAEAFPDSIRALVLDGTVDPRDSADDNAEAQYEAFSAAFDAYATECVTLPDCPIGTDPAQAYDIFEATAEPLRTAPLRVGTRALSYDDAQTAMYAALYDEASWPVLTQGIAALRAGDGRVLLELADSYWGRRADGTYDNSSEAFIAINCMDEERDDSYVDEDAVATTFDLCPFWPVEPTTLPHVPDLARVPPTLVIAVTGDPATPYQDGVDVAGLLDEGHLVSVDGVRHTASLQGNACVDDVVIDYLIDLTVPTGRTTCVF